ncbi:MAG: hypothetical protein PHI34_09520 [Acidobacteriota bacterium]|nr:hypothetical protein [Acidobacteriota bacterium]
MEKQSIMRFSRASKSNQAKVLYLYPDERLYRLDELEAAGQRKEERVKGD